MASAGATTLGQGSFVREKLLLGMTFPEYLRSLVTPFNLVAAAILAVGVPCLVYRFAAGLGASTNLSQAYPWGLWRPGRGSPAPSCAPGAARRSRGPGPAGP